MNSRIRNLKSQSTKTMADETKTKTRMKDPVCGKDVDPETAEYSANYKGKVYYFDSAECKSTFNEDPEQYAT